MPFGSLGSIWAEIGLNTQKLDQGLMAANTKLAAADKSINTFGQRLTAASTKMITTGAVMAGAIAASLIKVGTDFDDAYDKIRASTGKTGEAFKGLQDDFRAIAKDTPATFANISTAVSTLNSRLGLTGKPLQEISNTILELSRITETDLNTNVNEAAQLFNNWQVKTEDQTATLDLMLRATQQTGVGITDLMGEVTGTGPILRAMGFDLETTTALLGTLSKNGIDTSNVMMALKISLKTMAQEGIQDPQEALQTMIGRIKDATTYSDALALALKFFGAKGASAMVAIIREGKFNLDELVASLKTGSETIAKAAADTYDLKAAMQQLKNEGMLALEPVATKFFNRLVDIIKSFNQLSPATQKSVTDFATFGIEAAAVTAGVLLLAGAVGKLRAMWLANPMGIAIAGFVALNGVVDLGAGKLEKLDTVWGTLGGTMLRTLTPLTAEKQGLMDNITVAKALADGIIKVDDVKNLNIFTMQKELEKIKELRAEKEKDVTLTEEETTAIGKDLSTHELLIDKLALHAKAQRDSAAATEENTGAEAEQVKTIDELRGAYNALISTLFDGVVTYNNFQESEIAVKEAQLALTEAIKQYGIGSDEAIKAANSLDSANIQLMEDSFALSTSTQATTAQQEEARKKL